MYARLLRVLIVSFVLVASLWTWVPSDVAQSQSSDSDRDGLIDSAELQIAQTFFPKYEYDEDERDIIASTKPISTVSDRWPHDDVVYYYQVTPVVCHMERSGGTAAITFYDHTKGNPITSVLLTVVAAYEYDYVPLKTDKIAGTLAAALVNPGAAIIAYAFGSETDVFAHWGDLEKTEICLSRTEVSPGTGHYEVDYIHLRRHGHSFYYRLEDFEERDGSRVWLHVSEGKHAAYSSYNECEDYVDWKPEGRGWDEDCDDGEKIDPTVISNFSEFNVGEYAGSTVWMSGRAANIFPSETIWSNASSGSKELCFCGGYDIDNCQEERNVVGMFYHNPKCPGALQNQLYRPRCPFFADACIG